MHAALSWLGWGKRGEDVEPFGRACCAFLVRVGKKGEDVELFSRACCAFLVRVLEVFRLTLFVYRSDINTLKP